MKQQGAQIAVWGVGTRLATGYDQPALGGVYKLSALRHQGKAWEHKGLFDVRTELILKARGFSTSDTGSPK